MLKLAPLAAVPVAVAATLLASHLAMGNVPGGAPEKPAAVQSVAAVQPSVASTWLEPPAHQAGARPAPRVIPIVETEPYRPSPVKVTLRTAAVEPAAAAPAAAAPQRKVERAKPRHVAHAVRRKAVPAQPQAEPTVAQAPVAQPTRMASSGPLDDILKGLGLAD